MSGNSKKGSWPFKKINIETSSRRARTGLRREFAFQNQEKQKRDRRIGHCKQKNGFQMGRRKKNERTNGLGQQRAGDLFQNYEREKAKKRGPTNWPLPTKMLLSKMFGEGEAKGGYEN